MFDQEAFLEKVWDDLLSRETDRIITRFLSLDPGSQKTVLEHLQKMVSETDWHPEQVTSAKTALQAIANTEK